MLLSLSSLVQAVRRPVAVVDAEVVGLKSDIVLLRTAVADSAVRQRRSFSARHFSAYLVLRTLVS